MRGFYIAKEMGLFSKRGIDISIFEGSGGTLAAQVIAAGTQYQIGSASGGATAIGRARGLPIQSVAVLYSNISTVVFSRSDAPIRTPQDLVGRRIGLVAGSVTVDEYRGLLLANQIDRKQVAEVGVGFDPSPLLLNQVD